MLQTSLSVTQLEEIINFVEKWELEECLKIINNCFKRVKVVEHYEGF
jgi:hypothetical protein